MNFEAPLTSLVWLTSMISIVVTYAASYLLIPDLDGDTTLWWKLSTIITCGTLAGAVIPEFVKVFTSTESGPRQGSGDRLPRGRRVAQHPVRPDRRQLQRLLDGPGIVALMGVAYGVSTLGLGELMIAPAVFAFGLVAFGFLGMGPVTIAVDSYGPVTDNAQSVFELSTIETLPNISGRDQEGLRLHARLRERQALPRRQRRRRQHLQGHGQAGAHRHRRGRRDDADLLDHRGAHRRPEAGARPEPLAAPSAVPARPDHRRRDHLLVHRRLQPGGLHRRLPRRRVHQEEHQARRRAPRRPRSKTASGSWRSAPPTPRRACSTSS